MPEGHTIHRIARDHQKWFAGQPLAVMSPQGRFEEQAEILSGCKLTRVEAFGKHLIYQFGRQRMHVHLGLYGKFRIHKNPPPEPRGAVRVRMIGQERSFDLNGPNTCELLSKSELDALTARIGPDPLRSDADPELAWNRIRTSRTAIGALLLNQSVIAGLGNIYRAEILHILAIHPDRPGKEVSRDEFDSIWDLSVRLLQIGVKYNRIITTAFNGSTSGLSRLKSQERLLIYKKPECPRCHADVYYWDVGNRRVYACDACQV
ncbi:MAG: DNA-formamidopyrimidine glycosylase family protein [Planctomycetota bacterium]